MINMCVCILFMEVYRLQTVFRCYVAVEFCGEAWLLCDGRIKCCHFPT